MNVFLQALGAEFSGKTAHVRDLLGHKELGLHNGSFAAGAVPKHGCAFVTIAFEKTKCNRTDARD